MTGGEGGRNGVYLVRSQPQLEWLSVVRIPLAIAVLVGTLVVLVWGALLLLRALDVQSDFALKLLVGVAFVVSLYAANRAASKVRARGAKMLVAVGADEVRYAERNAEAVRFANRAVAVVSSGPNKLEVEVDGTRHVLPRTVVLEGDDSAAFLRLDVVNERVVVSRTSMDGESTDVLPFE